MGGQKYICEVLGCDPGTVKRGSDELQHGSQTREETIRKPGSGNKKTLEKMEKIDEVFLEIVQHHTAGSPIDEAVKWTNLGLKAISQAFHQRGMNVSVHVVKQLLNKHKYVKRKMHKTKTMKEAAQRNEQFENIRRLREEYTKEENPVISLDVKKEAIGNFYRNGHIYCTEPVEVFDHDFLSSAQGIVILMEYMV